MQFRIKFLLLFLFLSSFFSNAQFKPSKNYTTADGLPNNAVRSLYLDKNADLWIGTENGVSKLENGGFTNLILSNTITNNSCWDITQDANGAMWFASYGGGVYKFDGRKFTVFNHKNGLPIDRTRKLLAYKNNIYVGTELGVAIIDIKTNKLTIPKGILPHFGVFLVSDFIVYHNEVYFSAINEGLFKIAYKNNIPVIEPVFKFKFTYSLGFYDNTIFSGNKGFVDSFKIQDLISGKTVSKKIGKTIAWNFAKDKKNTIYAASWGVFDLSGGLYSIANNQMTNISEQYGIDSKNLLNVMYSPKKDILYVGSKDKGIYEIQLDKTIDYNPFGDKAIVDFETSNNQKIILHQDGISFLDAKNSISKIISLSDFKNVEVEYIKNSKQKLPTHQDGYYELNYNIPAPEIEFYEILKHQKYFWITSNIGVFEMNFEGKIINWVPIHSYKIGFTNDDKFIETIPYAGVRVYDDVYHLKAKHFSEFDKNTPLDIVGILNTDDKTYLISVFQGLFVHQNKKFHSLLKDNIWKESKLKFITKNKKGNLIIASEFGAVTVIDVSNSFRILKTIPKNQIIGNTITFLESYKDFIFIGTEKGINIYKNGIIQLFDKEQGLKDAAIRSSHIFENQLWLGTKKGFYTIDLEKLTANKSTVSSIEIRTISINSIPINQSNFRWFSYASDQLVCDYQHNTIAVDFVPNGHSFPNKLKFRYRLKTTNHWSPYSEKPFVYLSYLPNDTYLLEIEVLDLNAGKTSRFDILKISIQPPFWKTWWFVSLIFIIGILSTIIAILWTKRKAKQKAEAEAITEKIIAKSKLEALLSQMNPHFTFNALNTIQNFVFNKDALNSAIYISEFASLMRQTLDNSAKQTITIEDEIDYLETYISIENQRFDNRIQYQIIVTEAIDIAFIEIPTMLLQPFVENIFKHAFDNEYPNPTFKIEFTILDKNLMQILISDNGKGNTKATKTHVSKGIAIAKERLQIMQPYNLDPIKIDFSENGTTVNILILI
ncbi:sensor histidine kinase [Flavobacterium yafengii]|uniref:sensor histidine kinase n=1 Tax=Flavobacterium yafengii TaxID=3041253 RepID=UPI0024A9B9D6|nr:histidine kinase [Flavobacterium yafengii]MDI5897513.1 histidine kinase [Flavobacterium yafengii]